MSVDAVTFAKAFREFDEIEKKLKLPGFGKAPSSSGSSGSDAVAAWNAPLRTPDATKFAPIKRPSKKQLAQRQKDQSYRPSSRNARTTLARRSGAMASPQYSPRVKFSDF